MTLTPLDQQFDTPFHNAAYNFQQVKAGHVSDEEKDNIVEIFNLFFLELDDTDWHMRNSFGMSPLFLRSLWDDTFIDEENNLPVAPDRWGKDLSFYN